MSTKKQPIVKLSKEDIVVISSDDSPHGGNLACNKDNDLELIKKVADGPKLPKRLAPKVSSDPGPSRMEVAQARTPKRKAEVSSIMTVEEATRPRSRKKITLKTKSVNYRLDDEMEDHEMVSDAFRSPKLDRAGRAARREEKIAADFAAAEEKMREAAQDMCDILNRCPSPRKLQELDLEALTILGQDLLEEIDTARARSKNLQGGVAGELNHV